MRVLIWSPLYLPRVGGVEHYARRQARALAERGCTVEIVTNSLDGVPPTDEIDGIPVTRLPFPSGLGRDLDTVRTIRAGLADVMGRLTPDVVNVHTSGPSLLHLERHRAALRGALVLTLHGVYPPEADANGHLTRHLAAADGVITSSAITRRSLIEVTGLDVPIDVVVPSIEDRRRRPTPIPSAPVIAAVGRLVPDKGFDVLIRALPAVRAAVPGAHLVIVGDGPEHHALAGLAEALGVGDHVTLTGLVDDDTRLDHLDQAAVAAVPSRIDEGFGMVAIEASASGRPVVASGRGGLVEAVVDGSTGLLVPSDDVDALASALVGVLTDRALAERLGAAGVDHARRFTPDVLAEATLRTFERASR